MTGQYNQNNINVPRGSTLFTASAQLNLDDDLVVVSTALAPVTLTLPVASQIPGQEIKLKANDAGSTGNAVTIAALAGENIDGSASVTLTTDQESTCLKSDGTNWRVVPNSVASSEIRFSAETVQELEALTTTNGVQVGSLGIVLGTGNIYRASSATGSGSVWAPASGVFTARDFGAIGDNVTDDLIPLQTWLTTMDTYRAAFGGGAKGYLDPGDYRLSAGLTVGGETMVYGAGPLVSRLRASGAFSVLTATNVTLVKFADFGIEGSGQAAAGGVGVDFVNTSKSICDNLDVRTIERGVRAGSGSEDCRINRCWASATKTAFSATASSNGTHIFQCVSVNADVASFLLDSVSQCSVKSCEAQVAAGEIGVQISHTTGDAIANVIENTRTEGTAGTGIQLDAAGANQALYTSVVNPYWTGGLTPIIDGGTDTRVVNRSRYWNPLIAANPSQGVGEDLGRLSLSIGSPYLFDLLSHDITTGADGDPIMLRRQLVRMHCGSNNGVTAATVHYQAWQGELGSGSLAGARSQIIMPYAGRIIQASVICQGNLGSTLLELVKNGAGPAVVSDTQTVGAGAANGAVFTLSTSTADQHWAADDYITIGITPTNTVGTAVIVVEIAAEFYVTQT